MLRSVRLEMEAFPMSDAVRLDGDVTVLFTSASIITYYYLVCE